MDNDAQDARRYRALRNYSQAVRDWFTVAHPDHQLGDTHDRPYFGPGVVLCLTAAELDRACDEHLP